MAIEQNLVTKARLEQIKTAETNLVDNLDAHVNASLSKAHGIIYYNVGATYQDSHGDVVGTAIMRLSYNNVNYFAPLQDSLLAGKERTSGITPDINIGVIVPVRPGGTAWVTDFTPEDEQDIIVTNTELMLPHTLEAHWEAHSGGVYQIFAQVVYDSAGHRVANYVAKILIDGVEYLIPCDPRSGPPFGPQQPPRVAFPSINTLEGTNCNWCAMGRDDDQYGYFWYTPMTGGDTPATFKWQFNSYQPVKVNGKFWNDPLTGSGTWFDVNMTPGEHAMTGNPVSANSIVVGNKLTVHTSLGGNSKRICATIRGVWTNAAGETNTNFCMYQANDEDGSWIFADPDFNQTAAHVTIASDPQWIDGYYYPDGPVPAP